MKRRALKFAVAPFATASVLWVITPSCAPGVIGSLTGSGGGGSNFGAFAVANSRSVLFDGVNDQLLCGNNYAFTETTSFTISLWTRVQVSSDYMQFIGNYTFFGGSTRGWSFETFNGTELPIFFHMNHYASSNTIEVVSSGTTYPLNTWVHTAVTYDGSLAAGGVRIYRNGSNVGLTINRDGLTGSTVEPAQVLMMGASAAGEFLSGNLDEVSLFSGALSPTQVAELASLGVPTDLTRHAFGGQLLSWWRMGDGDTFPTIRDVKSTVNCTMTNMVAGAIVTAVPP